MTDREVWRVLFYEPPSKWRRRLARIIPWYHPQDRPVAYMDRSGVDRGSVWDSDADTLRVKWTSSGTFTLDEEDDR